MMGLARKLSILGLLLAGAAVAQPPQTAPSTTTAQPPGAVPAPRTPSMSTTTPTGAGTAVVEPEAIQALERMGAYLRTLDTFQVAGNAISEEVMQNGQKLMYTGAIDLVADRPGLLRVDLNSAQKRRQYYYDGRTLTIWAPRQAMYATLDAPPTIMEMISQFGDRFGIVVPLADLFRLGQDPQLTARLRSGFFVATEAVNDQTCDHYAFRQDGADWQVWIREGDQPLPCMLAIANTDDPAQPLYVVRMHWNLNPTITPETFAFAPPEGADRIPVQTASATPR